MLPTRTSGLCPCLRQNISAGTPVLGEHEELLDWINSLDSNQDHYLDALRACLLIFSVTDGQIVPRQFQLLAGLAALWGKNSIVNAGTGSGKTLSIVIPLLMDPVAVAIVISPLKRLQITQAEALERFLIKPLVSRPYEISKTLKEFPLGEGKCSSYVV